MWKTPQKYLEQKIIMQKSSGIPGKGPSRPLHFSPTLQLYYTLSFSLIDVK